MRTLWSLRDSCTCNISHRSAYLPFQILMIFLRIITIFKEDTARHSRQPAVQHGSSVPVSTLWKERADNFRIVIAHPCHSADRQYQYRQIQAAGQDIVGKRTRLAIAIRSRFPILRYSFATAGRCLTSGYKRIKC